MMNIGRNIRGNEIEKAFIKNVFSLAGDLNPARKDVSYIHLWQSSDSSLWPALMMVLIISSMLIDVVEHALECLMLLVFPSRSSL
jgi:hypothetical protein